MIDFVSTRETTDPQAARCARLLAAVIAQAVRDATQAMNVDEKRGDGVCHQARSAVEFLFGQRSVFPLYAELIGANADSIRHALVHGSPAPATSGYGLGAMPRRALRLRLRLRRCGLSQCLTDSVSA